MQEGMKERCPKDGHGLIQRADDMPAAVAIRLELFERNYAPVMDFYEGLGRISRVDGLGSPDAVFDRISRIVGELGHRF